MTDGTAPSRQVDLAEIRTISGGRGEIGADGRDAPAKRRENCGR